MDLQQAERWVSTKEIAEHLGITIDTVRRWIKDDKIPCHRVGKFWKFRVSDVDDWVKSGAAEEGTNGV